MAKPEQRIIISAGVTKDGNIQMSVDFFPKMPTWEEFKKLPDNKRAVVAVINQFAKFNKEKIAEMMEMKPAVEQFPTVAQEEAKANAG